MEAKRYGANIDMYIYANNDKEAKAFLTSIISDMNQKFDNDARAKKLVEIPFGSFNPRPVKL